jgi:hypothetical protein
MKLARALRSLPLRGDHDLRDRLGASMRSPRAAGPI